MTHTKRISEIIKSESDHSVLLRASQKARKPRSRITKEPPPIGHILAVMLFAKGEHLATLFVDHVTVCKSHTVLHYDRSHLETYPEELESSYIDLSSAKFYYKNDTSIEIIRI